MSSYKELLARKLELDQAIEKMRITESKNALSTIHQLIATFGFTAQQVFPYKAPTKKKVPAKYYNPDNGESWTGRGKPPKWIEGKDRAQFEIATTTVQPSMANDSNNPFPIQ